MPPGDELTPAKRHHCAQPILRRLGVETTVRPSLAFDDTFDEIDRLVAVVRRLAGQRRAG